MADRLIVKMYTQDDVFVVTGATSGIGKRYLALLDRGATVTQVLKSKKLASLHDISGGDRKLFLEVEIYLT